MKVYFLTYSDDRFGHKGGVFRERQLAQIKGARVHGGIEHFKSWTWEDMIQTEFYREHHAYLDMNAYHNGFVFKPYIILDLLKQINEDDIVFYHDCAPRPLKSSAKPMIDLCVKNGGSVFMQWGDHNRNWVKRDAFYYMGCDTEACHEAVSLQATWLVIQKKAWSMRFVEEWLKFNLDERIASYVKPDTCGLPPLKDFVENRGDQSVMSVLAFKYGIKSFYGLGAEENRDVNRFMSAIPKNIFEEIYFKARAYRRISRRKKYVADYVAANKINYLRGDLPPAFRDHPYFDPEVYQASWAQHQAAKAQWGK
jgi:hypothetical protein